MRGNQSVSAFNYIKTWSSIKLPILHLDMEIGMLFIMNVSTYSPSPSIINPSFVAFFLHHIVLYTEPSHYSMLNHPSIRFWTHACVCKSEAMIKHWFCHHLRYENTHNLVKAQPRNYGQMLSNKWKIILSSNGMITSNHMLSL